MKFTDQEIDSIALAIYNAARDASGQARAESLGAVHQPLPWRMAARAALEAREALFETVGERWVVEVVGGRTTYWSPLNALRAREGVRKRGCEAKVIHITAKRRKR